MCGVNKYALRSLSMIQVCVDTSSSPSLYEKSIYNDLSLPLVVPAGDNLDLLINAQKDTSAN